VKASINFGLTDAVEEIRAEIQAYFIVNEIVLSVV
jgi:hypothetical protein